MAASPAAARDIESRARQWAARHTAAADLAVAAVLAGLTVGTEAGSGSSPGWWLIAGVACFAPLAWRRRHPLLVTAAVAGTALIIFTAGQRLLAGSAFVALWMAVYSVAAAEPRRRAVRAAGILEAFGIAVVARWAPGSGIAAGFVLTTGAAAAAVMLGASRQTRRAYLAALEYERAQQARLAVATERARIAREVHDIVTHSLSVMVALADGASAANTASPERAGAVMRQVAATGRQAIGEMRRIVGTLRTDEDAGQDQGADRPLPGLDDLEDLLDQVRAAGLPVRLSVTGHPRPLSSGVELAVYRIIQESLTNARKHARGAAARVTLRYLEDGIEAEISNDGPPGRHAPPGDGGGHGITGMRERAAAYGGAVTAGPRPEGGWLVRARLGGEEET